MRTLALVFFLTLLSLTKSFCQTLTIDNTFNIGTGIDTVVNVVRVQQDGKILVGGLFSHYNGVPRKNLVRLNVDGSIDNSFNIGSGFNGLVYDILPLASGRIYVVGSFTKYNNSTCNHIVRLFENGSIDALFNTESGLNREAYGIVAQDSGKVIVCGNFDKYKGITALFMARIDSLGNFDTGFKGGQSFDSNVIRCTVLPDGKIMACGQFTAFGSYNISGLVRLSSNGSFDPTFSHNLPFATSVHDFKFQTDGRLIIGGFFNISASGKYYNSLLRLKSNGKIDTSFATTFLNNVSSQPCIVYNILVEANDKILFGGLAERIGSQTIGNFGRLNRNGGFDQTFPSGVGCDRVVNSILRYDNNRLLIGGGFSNFNGSVYNRLIRFNMANPTNNLELRDFHSLKLFPNPTSRFLNYSSDYLIGTIEIYNSIGHRINIPEREMNMIDLEYLLPGQYYLKALTTTGFCWASFTKQ